MGSVQHKELDEAPNENAFVMPAPWRAMVRPRRGGVTDTVAALDESAADRLAWLIKQSRQRLTEYFSQPQLDPELATAGAAALRGERSPATVAALLRTLQRLHQDSDVLPSVTDAVVAGHGLPFAAAVLLERARFLGPDSRPVAWEDFRVMDWRLRELVAFAGDAAYAEVVATLRRMRRTPLQLLLAACVAPGETGWVDECCTLRLGATPAIHPLLLAAIGSPDQLITAGSHEHHEPQYGLGELNRSILYTLVDGVGPPVAPFLARQWDRWTDPAFTDVLLELATDEAFQLMVNRFGEPAMPPVVLRAARRYPVRALRLLAEAAAGGTKTAVPARQLLYSHLLGHPGLATPELSPLARTVFDEVAAATVRMPVAQALPELLVRPPWLDRGKPVKPVVRADLATPGGVELVWRPGEQQEWLAIAQADPHAADPDHWVREIGWFREHPDRPHVHLLDCLAYGPEELVRPFLADWHGSLSDSDLPSRLLVAKYGPAALPIALQVAKSNPANRGAVLGPLVSVEVAELIAGWLGSKQGRNAAHRWLDRHRDAAARLLIPAALSKPGPRRTAADAALRYLASTGSDVVAAAGGYDDAARSAIAAFLAMDPLAVLPTKIPAVPEWADPELLPQIRLAGADTALPADATRHVITMLALSKPDRAYPGIEVVRELVDPGSLAEFGWALFSHWQFNGSANGEDWILGGLSHVGDDDTVRRLAPLIRVWPGQGGHNRAVLGLDVLTGIGSETALGQLAGIAQNVKFKGLKTKAEEKIQDLADALGLGADELADRLVPTFGLDDAAVRTLDYGSRTFLIGLDEQLRPFVTDDSGARRKDLPKPGASDGERAATEFKRFAALKKELRAVAADQIRRLERAMIDERRWPLGTFRDVFGTHPLLSELARRLVWRTGDGVAFRVADDGTFAGLANDELALPDRTRVGGPDDDEFALPGRTRVGGPDDHELGLPDQAWVGIAHPLHLGDTVGAWARLFAADGIRQPFPQLDRPVRRLTEAELATGRLARFEGVTVPSAKVTGLRRRGWELARPQDNGLVWWVFRPVPGHRAVAVTLDPGLVIDRIEIEPEQRLSAVWFNPGPGGAPHPSKAPLPFGELPPVLAAEITADLVELTS
ncbi:MAG TPA: DUF4132 domain-containing protein [Pseudonocardiaceae bacterium]|nr:DUF4132 domain-containing protein [Pseudonocardiaceae bacterium]